QAQDGRACDGVMYLPGYAQPRRQIPPGSRVKGLTAWYKGSTRSIRWVRNYADGRLSAAYPRNGIDFPSQPVRHSQAATCSPGVLSKARKCVRNEHGARNVVDNIKSRRNRARVDLRRTVGVRI